MPLWARSASNTGNGRLLELSSQPRYATKNQAPSYLIMTPCKPKLLLFLDEPTSGLDSQSAWAIVSFLRELADHGQAILCT
jgi:ABC-type uncharacterized transport system ATPase subunit